MLNTAWRVLTLHNPLTKNGRRQIMRTILASGPAAAAFPNLKQSETLTGPTGWRFGTLVASYMVGTCLVINILFLLFAIAFAHVSDGTGTLFKGDCARARILDTGVHVIINGLATAVVGASNYTMQCLAAPSRSEVNAAHAEGTWLDIGVPSLRNLRHISRRRVALWSVLAVSSVPVHLMWNSVIFSTLQDNTFVVIGASDNILQDRQYACMNGSFNITDITVVYSSFSDYNDVVCEMYDRARSSAETETSLIRLEAEECIEQYATGIQSRWSNVVVVVHNADLVSQCELEPIPRNATQLFAFLMPGVFWQWGENCYNQSLHGDEVLAHTDRMFITDWVEPYVTDLNYGSTQRVPQYPIEYCLAMEAPKSCRLEVSLQILFIMIACNAFKFFAVVCTLKVITKEHFVTLGDAIASFLKIPDELTVGHCLKAKRFFQQKRFWLGQHKLLPRVYRTQSLKSGKRVRLYWFQAAPAGSWILLLIL